MTSMSDERDAGLSGYWTGVYDYPGADEPVPFNAVLDVSGAAVSGETIEPNTFAPTPDGELFAWIDGSVADGEIAFVKTYEPLPGAGHAVSYVGRLERGGKRIVGRWRIQAGWEGPFVMDRSGDAAALTALLARRHSLVG